MKKGKIITGIALIMALGLCGCAGNKNANMTARKIPTRCQVLQQETTLTIW